MTVMKKFGKQTSQYFIGEIVVLVAGLLSFPILTRMLSKEEYGLMSLVTTTLSIINVVASAGLRPSLIRFYGQYKNQADSKKSIAEFYGTLLLVTVSLGLLGSLLLYLSRYFLHPFMPHSPLLPILSFASVLVLFEVATPLFLNAFRAEEKPVWYSIAQITNKYLGLILALVILSFTTWRLYGFFYGAHHRGGIGISVSASFLDKAVWHPHFELLQTHFQ